ncbi:hypothetical protein XENTR_v10013384 [Xenopus tropicalis]|nr:hypothetical protein XENTR_v10013384 [Xenopus tropicalis]
MGAHIGVWWVAPDAHKISLRGAWAHKVTPLPHIPTFCLHVFLLPIINPLPNKLPPKKSLITLLPPTCD